MKYLKLLAPILLTGLLMASAALAQDIGSNPWDNSYAKPYGSTSPSDSAGLSNPLSSDIYGRPSWDTTPPPPSSSGRPSYHSGQRHTPPVEDWSPPASTHDFTVYQDGKMHMCTSSKYTTYCF